MSGITDDDCKISDPDARLSAAVAMDVFGTRLAKLVSAEADIQQLTEAALELAHLGGHTEHDTAALLATAHGKVGDARAAIAPQLASAEAVATAVTLLRDGAQAIVEEARLGLETSLMTNYRKG
ncbi:MAG: hypothetical protein H7Z43_00125 [Clostridia bacterium]|nr:hypothetical protein [Deltaproteobacteria bacterium]